MMLENHQQLHHTFFELYIYQDSIQLKKGSSQTTISTILQVLYLSGQYTTKEEPLEATVSHIS